MQAKTNEELTPLFDIDQNTLDEEWHKQVLLAFEYNTQLAEARVQLEERKVELDLCISELDKEFRDEDDVAAEDSKRKKRTEKALESEIVRHPRYQKCQKRLVRAKRTVGLFDAVCTAIEHRKRALEKLTDLFAMGYFAGPSKKENDSLRGVKKKKRFSGEED